MSQDLFSYQGEQQRQRLAPLADRMRPQSLEDFEGQSGILADGRLLRRAIKADRVGNLILHGSPGVGKTTLARIIAGHTRAHFSSLNAVLAGVKDLRVEVDAARQRLERHGLRSILFIDEVHRFNSAQQDALLPWVENGTVTLIGATTENPYFEVNKALVSRSRLFRLLPLEPEDLHRLLQRALSDAERGYGSRSVRIDPEAADHLVDVANGDARSLLNALELAVESSEADAGGTVQIDLATAEESIQQRAVLYDKHGDAHYDTISAFIKSLRGSDPDAALFWLARMVEAGENPRFIFRRMLIAAGEDVGLADPQAIVVVEACAAAFERVGLPEGSIPWPRPRFIWPARRRATACWVFLMRSKPSEPPTNKTFRAICAMPTGMAPPSAMGWVTATPTPMPSTGWSSNTCPQHCKARCSGNRGDWAGRGSGGSGWRNDGPLNSPRPLNSPPNNPFC